MGGAIFLIVIIVIVAWVLASCIRIVPQAARWSWRDWELSGYLEHRYSFQGTFYWARGKKGESERAGCRFSTAAGYYQR